MVLGLDVAEDVSDDGTDPGEYQAGYDDCCEDHGSLRSRAGGFRAPPEKPQASWVLSPVSCSPQRRNALLAGKLTARSGTGGT